MDLPIIDAWAQPTPPGAMDGPVFSRLIAQSGAEDRVKFGASADAIVGLMDLAGVHKALLSAWRFPDRTTISNDQVAEFVSAHPDRFIGVGTVNLDSPMDAVAEFDRMVDELGFKAMRVLPWVWNRPPNDKHFYPLYVRCIERNIPFCTQVGHTGPLMPSEPGRPVPYIDEVALTFPDLKIVCGHIGYPWTDEMIAVAWKHENVFIDTSAYRPRYYPPQLVQFIATYGQDKVMFGTNFPMLSFKDCVDDALELKISNSIRRKFLCENAQRVFNID